MRHALVILMLQYTFCSESPMCIKTMFGATCAQDKDCQLQDEAHLFCNKTSWPNTCAFNDKVYIGHVYENWDCPGAEFSAITWGNPVSSFMASTGLDCMRLCLHVRTCFGISVIGGACYLKNDVCFKNENLVRSPGTIIGVLRVVREDFHCGCHYPFERERLNGTVTQWYPQCPASHLAPKYGCCSKKGLCHPC